MAPAFVVVPRVQFSQGRDPYKASLKDVQDNFARNHEARMAAEVGRAACVGTSTCIAAACDLLQQPAYKSALALRPQKLIHARPGVRINADGRAAPQAAPAAERQVVVHAGRTVRGQGRPILPLTLQPDRPQLLAAVHVCGCGAV